MASPSVPPTTSAGPEWWLGLPPLQLAVGKTRNAPEMELLLELRINSGRLQPLLALAYRKRALACRYGAHSAALLQAGDPCLVAFVPAISRLGSSLGGRAERLQARAALLWRQLEQQARRLLNFASVANGVAQELEAEGLAARAADKRQLAQYEQAIVARLQAWLQQLRSQAWVAELLAAPSAASPEPRGPAHHAARALRSTSHAASGAAPAAAPLHPALQSTLPGVGLQAGSALPPPSLPLLPSSSAAAAAVSAALEAARAEQQPAQQPPQQPISAQRHLMAAAVQDSNALLAAVKALEGSLQAAAAHGTSLQETPPAGSGGLAPALRHPMAAVQVNSPSISAAARKGVVAGGGLGPPCLAPASADEIISASGGALASGELSLQLGQQQGSSSGAILGTSPPSLTASQQNAAAAASGAGMVHQ